MTFGLQRGPGKLCEVEDKSSFFRFLLFQDIYKIKSLLLSQELGSDYTNTFTMIGT